MPESAITRSEQTAGRSAKTFPRPLDPYPGSLTDMVITDEGGLNISWTGGLLRTPAGTLITIIAGTGTCTDDAVNFLKWVSGTALILATTDATHPTEVPIGHIACQNGDIWDVHNDPNINRVVPDIQHGLEQIFPLAIAAGCLVSEDTDATSPLDVTLSAGSYFHDLHDEHPITAFDTRTANTLIRCFIDGSGPETWDFTADGAQSEIDVANWNSGTSLIGTSGGKFYKGMFVISADNVFWIYAQTEHNTIAQALDGAIPSTPPGLANFPRSVAYVYQHGDTAFVAASSDRWSDIRPLVPGSPVAGPITDHGELVGLADPTDHLYALLIDGTRALTAPWAANNDITGLTLLEVDSLTIDGTTISSSGPINLSTIDLVKFTGGNFTLIASGFGDNVLLIFDALAQDGTLTYMNTEDEFRFSAPLLAATHAGGAASGGDMILTSTTHGTKNDIFLGSAGNSVYDEANDRLGLGIATPQSLAHLLQTGDAADDAILANWGLIIGNSLNTTGLEVGIGFRISSGQFDTVIPGAAITHERTGLNSRGSLHFKTSSDGASLTTRMSIDKDGNVGLGQATPLARLHIEETGTAKANLDIMQIVNAVNAADMDETGTSILFRQFHTGGSAADMGRLKFNTKEDWTSTGSTQDGEFIVEVALNGTLVERLSLTGNNTGFDGLNLRDTKLWVYAENSNAFINCIAHDTTQSSGGRFVMRRTRGSQATPLAVVNGDNIGTLEWRAPDTNDSYVQRAEVVCSVDGAVSGSGVVPMSIMFATSATNAFASDRLTIDSSGDITFNTSGVRVNFGGTTEYIEDGGGSLDFFTGNAKVLEITVQELVLRIGATHAGSLRWDSNFVMLDHVTTEKQRITATAVQFADSVSIGSVSATPDAKLDVDGEIAIKDGMTAPSATVGKAKLFVDTADGDLKIIFGDGTVKTIVVDT